MKKVFLKIIFLISIILFLFSSKTMAETNNWKEWQEKNYWEWHTRTTTNDKAYNGEHIKIEDDKINFYGYGVVSYKDFLYKKYKNNGKKTFSFRIDESQANYHTLDGAGIIFNSNIVNNKLTGYVLLFKEKEIVIYRLENINIDEFETTPNKTIEMYGTIVSKCSKNNTGIHNLVIEITPTNISIKENDTQIVNEKLEYSLNVGNDFGLISSYSQHDCAILSKIEFSQFDIKIEDYTYEILNTDINNNPVGGGTFILEDEKGNKILEESKNENGVFSVKNLTPGRYIVKQIKAPDGYEINNEEFPFIVSNDGKMLDINTNKETNIIVKNNKKQQTVKNENKASLTIVDNTLANKIIPKTGITRIVIIFGIIFTFGIIQYIKYKKILKCMIFL